VFNVSYIPKYKIGTKTIPQIVGCMENFKVIMTHLSNNKTELNEI